MPPTLRNVYHISAFSWYAYVVKSLADKGAQELPPGIFVYGGPWKYLTFLNLVSPVVMRRVLTESHRCKSLLSRCFKLLQMLFFGLAAVNDLRPHPESALNRCEDFLFSVFVFPVGTVRHVAERRSSVSPMALSNCVPFCQFVVLLFWAIFAYDRELVYPATIDAFFPPWINHAMVQ